MWHSDDNLPFVEPSANRSGGRGKCLRTTSAQHLQGRSRALPQKVLQHRQDDRRLLKFEPRYSWRISGVAWVRQRAAGFPSYPFHDGHVRKHNRLDYCSVGNLVSWFTEDKEHRMTPNNGAFGEGSFQKVNQRIGPSDLFHLVPGSYHYLQRKRGESECPICSKKMESSAQFDMTLNALLLSWNVLELLDAFELRGPLGYLWSKWQLLHLPNGKEKRVVIWLWYPWLWENLRE